MQTYIFSESSQLGESTSGDIGLILMMSWGVKNETFKIDGMPYLIVECIWVTSEHAENFP
jgi:hypothetical protein